MKLIVGLGNPGRSYANNRHNIGFMCVNHFARKHGVRLDKSHARARAGTGKIDGIEIAVARPQTYMNLSGESVCRLVKKYRINLDDLLVIHDDLDLPLGKIRIGHGSSGGGHKGANSIIDCLGSKDFVRIRIGIGRPALKMTEADIIDYVLSDFTTEEKKVVGEIIPRVSDAIYCFLTEGLTTTMNKYN